MVIGIIGGGASGMVAALAAAQNPKNTILLFERQARLGKKLLATGNGRCNLTNLSADGSCYHGKHPEFAAKALQMMPVAETIKCFEALGLYTVSEASGRVYPYSNQANSVVDVLRFGLQKSNIRVLTGCEVTKAQKKDGQFWIDTGAERYFCDRLIIACGGLAGTKVGGSMSGYQLLRGFGHHMTRLRPALVQLKSSWRGCMALKGVRANCHAAIIHNGMVFAQSQGELQFTEYGLSGPVIFEISRDVCQSEGQWSCILDFLPQISFADLEKILRSRRASGWLTEELFTGILHNRLGRVLCGTVGLKANTPVSQLSDDKIAEVCSAAKGFCVELTQPMGMDSAQVTAGGILTEEFCDDTMESRMVDGLYACGEVLDIDGDCGGFNLQWAWSSGYLAGKSAGGEGV